MAMILNIVEHTALCLKLYGRGDCFVLLTYAYMWPIVRMLAVKYIIYLKRKS